MSTGTSSATGILTVYERCHCCEGHELTRKEPLVCPECGKLCSCPKCPERK